MQKTRGHLLINSWSGFDKFLLSRWKQGDLKREIKSKERNKYFTGEFYLLKFPQISVPSNKLRQQSKKWEVQAKLLWIFMDF